MKKSIVFIVIIFIVSCTFQPAVKETGIQIHDIQGCAHLSPLNGMRIYEVQGVVTHKSNNGFTMQSSSPDEKACTSEAIFVFTKTYPQVSVADLVSVSGLVEEFQPGEPDDHNLTITEIIDPEIRIVHHDSAMPQAVVLDHASIPDQVIENDGFRDFDIREDGMDYYESLESMLVEIDQAIVVAPRNRYNEIVVVPEELLSKNIVSGLGPILETEYDQNPEFITVKLPASQNDQIGTGAIAENTIIGILDYSFGLYKILCFSQVNFSSNQKEIGQFFHQLDGLSMASYNVNNLSRFGDDNRVRSVAHQIVDDLDSPYLIVLHEIMDDSGNVNDGVVTAEITLDLLVTEIRNAGGPDYAYSDSPPEDGKDGGIEGGNIRSVLLYRLGQDIQLEYVTPEIDEIKYKDGKFTVPANPYRIGKSSEAFFGSRKPPVWLMSVEGRQVFVIGVHLISKSENSPNWGDLQPPVHPNDQKRDDQARYIQTFVASIIDLNDEIPIILAGDLNSDPWATTMAQIMGNSLIDAGIVNSVDYNYSYIFEGNAQQLDYILINQNLSEVVKHSQIIHINTSHDESNQISDHDPVIAVFDLSP